MKKIIAYVLPLSILAGIILGGLIINNRCEKDQNIIFDSGEYYDKAWLLDNSDSIHSIDHICVPDSSTAMKISNMIFSNLQDDGLFKDYVMQSVFFDESDEVWILNYYPNEKNYIGSTCSIAISKQTAEVLKIWVTE